MKKYLSRALFYKEWKGIYWMIIPLFLINSRIRDLYMLIINIKKCMALNPIYTVKINYTNVSGYDLFFERTPTQVMLILMVLLVLLMTYFVVIRDRRYSIESFIEYMPFNKQQRVFSKLLVGIMVLFISSILGFLLDLIVILNNQTYLKDVIRMRELIAYFIISFLVWSLVYAVLIVVQLLCRNTIFGLLLGFSVIELPSSIDLILYQALNSSFRSLYASIDRIFNNLIYKSYLEGFGVDTKMVNQITYITGDRYNMAIIKLIIIMAVLAVILVGLLKYDVKASSKTDLVFRVFSSISIGSFVAKTFRDLINAQYYSFGYFLVLNLVFMTAAYFAYCRVDKAVGLSKYDAEGEIN